MKVLKVILCSILVFFTYFSVQAEEISTIKITSQIQGISNPLSNTFTYKIEEVGQNLGQVNDYPKELAITITDFDQETNIAKEEVELDFSNVSYKKPGDFEYLLKEVSSTDEETFSHSEQEYKIYVSVRNQNGILVPIVSKQGMNIEKNEKEDIVFNHAANYTYLKISTKVDGKTALENDQNTYFKYRLSIQGLIGDRYIIDGQDKEIIYNGETIQTDSYYEVKEDGDNFIFIYMKHNQTITIGKKEDIFQIPVGISYSIQKIDGLKWDTSIDGIDGITTSKNVSLEENITTFTHKRDTDIAITGLFMSYIPLVLLLLITIGSITLIKRMRVREVFK